ncbi:DUF3944 domain-containing protein [Gallibacterium trehalosifermentans]|uniref:DUF3944 domain-containing protein n=1 Tax=Gallibacterium trehalosifermentans TaxID=516935 RepID=A0ABV6GZB6_9PAST
MAYRFDTDLEFLSQLTDAELEPLVDIITKDKDGDSRWTETLTTSDVYKHYYPQHSKYWQEIAEEVQLFGGNTIVSLFRGGKGVLYREILIDVANKLKVNFNKDSSVERIEQNLFMKLFEDMTAKMTSEELRALLKELDVPNSATLTPEVMTTTFITIFRTGGFKSYQISLWLVNTIMKALIGRGLTIGGNATLARMLAVATGPVGWVATGIWTLFDIASPAYRVTVPAVICIAALRLQYQMNQSNNQ